MAAEVSMYCDVDQATAGHNMVLQYKGGKKRIGLRSGVVAHTCHGFLMEAYMMNLSTYEVKDHVSTPLTPIFRLIAPDIQNMGPPATEDSRRHTPNTFP